jgi:hypothetical protein
VLQQIRVIMKQVGYPTLMRCVRPLSEDDEEGGETQWGPDMRHHEAHGMRRGSQGVWPLSEGDGGSCCIRRHSVGTRYASPFLPSALAVCLHMCTHLVLTAAHFTLPPLPP